MWRQRRIRVHRYQRSTAGPHGKPAIGQNVRRDDARSGRDLASPAAARLVATTHAVLDSLAAIVARVFFRRLTVHDRERFPRSGAVLVVANHPSTWADAVLLAVALRRRLHFLVHAPLYRPRARGWLLSFYGALPVFHHDDDIQSAARNAETNRACYRLFAQGEVVVTFPEGISRSDWHLEPLRVGTAWLALAGDAPHAGARAFQVLPVGLCYGDRTAFRSDADVVVGETIDPAPFRRLAATDARGAAHALTDRLTAALGALVPNTSTLELESLAKALVEIAEVDVGGSGGGRLGLARDLAQGLERTHAREPERIPVLRRDVTRYRRFCRALRLADAALAESGRAVWRETLVLGVAVVGGLPALLGWAIHWLPVALTRLATRRFARDSTRVAFSRMVAGIVLFPATYVVVGGLLRRFLGLPHERIAGLVVAAAALGCLSAAYERLLRGTFMRLRRGWIERRAPALIARARAARTELLGRVARMRAGGVA